MKGLLLIPTLCFIALIANSQTSPEVLSTPPMGWISWNLFEGNINEKLVKEIADALVSTGMKEAGYEYLILDDLWHGGRDENGNVYPDREKFPSGMKALADYVHSKGLKFGIYTDIAEYTCAGMPGSFGYEEQDARTYAEWGVDYIKCDYCHAPQDLWTAIDRYTKFIKAIREVKPDMVFAICEWGQRAPWLWGKEVGGNLWRTTWDMRDTWEHHKYDSGHNGIMEGLDRQVGLERFAGPGHWNDPDMLVIGLHGKGKSASNDGAAGCTVTEYEAQMGLWCLLAAPLLVTCDIRNMDEDTKRILTNTELLQVNQDKLGKQAGRIWKEGVSEIWAKELSDGSFAVGFLNRDDEKSREISLDIKMLGFEKPVLARNLWKHKDLGVFSGTIKLEVASHECKVLRISEDDN
ncbi:MAG: glycoside hydrolase family 27 protein [Bacteroidales bacterium]|nr:glycoside hydrolase family 27 protein [Bacteroidales bacterium]MCF8458251.1 glycoside hydrolase family 27 protein [Bacteroidales bacterium]